MEDEFHEELGGQLGGVLVPPLGEEILVTLRQEDVEQVLVRCRLSVRLVGGAVHAHGRWGLSEEVQDYQHGLHRLLQPPRPHGGVFPITEAAPAVTHLELSRAKLCADLPPHPADLRFPDGLRFFGWRGPRDDEVAAATYTLVFVGEEVPEPEAGAVELVDPNPDTISTDSEEDGAEEGVGGAAGQAGRAEALFGGLGVPQPLADEDAGCQLSFSPETVADFWQMIWQAKCGTVCVLLPSSAFPLWSQVQNLKKPYKPFWPTRSQEVAYFGAGSRWTIKCEEAVENVEWTSYFLLICRSPPMSKSGKAAPLMGAVHTSLCVRLVHYEAWKREKAPPQGVLRLLGRLHLFKDSANLKSKTKHPAMALVCPTGVERCGLVAALDMAARKLLSVRLVDVQRQVSLLRRDRHGAVSKAWEYLWLHDQLLHLCLTTDILGPKQRAHLGHSLLDLSSHLSPDPLMGAAHTSLCVRLVHYEAWQREKAPPQGVLRLLGRLHLVKDSANLKDKTKHSAIALVCPTGVERCGLVAALDMAARKLLSVRLVDVQRQVSLLRRDRHGAVSKAWEHLWLHDQLLHLCLTTDILGPKQRAHLGRSLLDLSSHLSPDPNFPSLQDPQLTSFY